MSIAVTALPTPLARPVPVRGDALGMASVLMAAVCFASIGTLTPLALGAGMSLWAFTVARAGIGALFLFGAVAILIARGASWTSLRALPRRTKIALLAATLANGVLNIALLAAYGELAAAFAVAGFYTYPALVALISAALGRERLTRVRVSAIALALTGLIVVVLSGLGPDARFSLLGFGFALLAAFSQTVYLLVAHDYTEVPAEQGTAVVLAGGAGIAVLFALASGGGAGLVTWTAHPAAWPFALAAGLLAAGIPMVLLLRGLRIIGGTRTSVFMLAEPVAVVLIAALVLGQGLAPLQVAGIGAIVGAGFLCARR